MERLGLLPLPPCGPFAGGEEHHRQRSKERGIEDLDHVLMLSPAMTQSEHAKAFPARVTQRD